MSKKRSVPLAFCWPSFSVLNKVIGQLGFFLSRITTRVHVQVSGLLVPAAAGAQSATIAAFVTAWHQAYEHLNLVSMACHVARPHYLQPCAAIHTQMEAKQGCLSEPQHVLASLAS
jgi:hypothetical protein